MDEVGPTVGFVPLCLVTNRTIVKTHGDLMVKHGINEINILSLGPRSNNSPMDDKSNK